MGLSPGLIAVKKPGQKAGLMRRPVSVTIFQECPAVRVLQKDIQPTEGVGSPAGTSRNPISAAPVFETADGVGLPSVAER